MYRTRLDQQMVWNNKEICVNGIPVYYEDFREAGLWTIKDLYENRKLRNFEFWKSKGIKHSRYLEWRGLISAISLKYKKIIKEDALSLNSDPILKISKNKEMVRAQCRDICKLLIKNIFCRPTAEKYYPNISQEDWKKIYLIPWQCSMDTKSRAFQYSFLQRIIVTNVKLHKFGKVDSELCTFCETEIEGLEHLFFECSFVQNLWTKIKSQLKIQNDLSLENIFLGVYEESNDLINTVIISVKRSIYKAWYKKTRPAYELTIKDIKEIMQMEQNIALKNNAMQKFAKKWSKLNF